VKEGGLPAVLIRGLSDSQKAVVSSNRRYLRVLAGAGAGKTETMTRRIVALLSQGEHPSSIVAFTFTERAAAEIKERIHLRAEELLPKKILAGLGDLFVGTIHSFCLRLLQDHYGYGNYEALDANQEMAFLLREGWNLGIGKGGRLAHSGVYSDDCETFRYSVDIVHNESLDRKLLHLHEPPFAAALEEYERLLDKHRILTFGRMVSLSVGELEKNPAPARTIRWLIVDEFQDVNKTQEQLVRLLSKDASCYVVGDPRQCIYGWRGSDPSCFDRFAEEHKAPTISLLDNYRSGSAIVRFGNEVAGHLESADLRVSMAAKREMEGSVVYAELSDPRSEADWITSQITGFVEKKVCSFGDIAILLRSVKTSGEPIIRSLKGRGVPYIVGGSIGLFGRDETAAIGAVFVWLGGLSWKDSPWAQEESPNEELPRLASERWPGGIPRDTLDAWKRELIGARKPRFRNLSAAFHDLLQRLGVDRWNPDDKESAVRLANLGRFNGLLNDFEAARRRGGRPFDPPRDLRNLAWFIKTQGLSGYDEQAVGDLGDIDAVKVMTIHQAKGLEWPIVFVPALVAGRFPGRMVGREAFSWIPRTLYDIQRYSGTVEDERKVFYVATTRARDGLALSRFTRMKNARAASVFLEELGTATSSAIASPFIETVEIGRENNDEVVSFTPGEIIDYRRCPHQYRLSHDWGYQAGVVHELGFGKAVHHVLHQVALAAKAGKDPTKVLDKILDEGFHMPYLSPTAVSARKRTARKLILQYIRKHRADFSHIEEIEARLEFRLAKLGNVRATVKGRVDVIHSPDGARELRDYKTMDMEDGESVEDKAALEDAAFQIRTYAIGERELSRPVGKASVAFLHSGTLMPISIRESDLERTRQQAQEAVEGILAGEFPGRPGAPCKGCDFKMICPHCDKSAKKALLRKRTAS
jgi:DNA helicase II / ATP-dependent DNA helicase PcrA